MTQTQAPEASSNRAESWLITIAAGVLAFTCYGAGLSYGLTDLDTMMNIAAVRVDSFGDLETVLFSKLTGGRAHGARRRVRAHRREAVWPSKPAIGFTLGGVRVRASPAHGRRGARHRSRR